MASPKQRTRRKRRVRASGLLTFRVTPTNGLRPTESVRTRPNGTHHAAIPVEQFSQVTPKIILPGATKDALKQLPEFKYSKGWQPVPPARARTSPDRRPFEREIMQVEAPRR